jgi:hypothetical protein
MEPFYQIVVDCASRIVAVTERGSIQMRMEPRNVINYN